MGDKHIVHLTEMGAVKIYIGKGIDAVKLKSYVIAECGVKVSLVYGRAVFNPAVLIVVIAVVYILNYACRNKIGMQAPGNPCVKSLTYTRIGKAPATV